MPEFLETSVDKFTFRIASDRLYSEEGVWAKEEGNLMLIGLSDFVQQRSGDVAFAEVKPAGTKVAFEDEIAVIRPSRSTSAWAPRWLARYWKAIRQWKPRLKPSTWTRMEMGGWLWSIRMSGVWTNPVC